MLLPPSPPIPLSRQRARGGQSNAISSALGGMWPRDTGRDWPCTDGHVLVNRCVNEEVIELTSCEAIGRAESLPPLRFGLLGEYSLDRKVYAD